MHFDKSLIIGKRQQLLGATPDVASLLRRGSARKVANVSHAGTTLARCDLLLRTRPLKTSKFSPEGLNIDKPGAGRCGRRMRGTVLNVSAEKGLTMTALVRAGAANRSCDHNETAFPKPRAPERGAPYRDNDQSNCTSSAQTRANLPWAGRCVAGELLSPRVVEGHSSITPVSGRCKK